MKWNIFLVGMQIECSFEIFGKWSNQKQSIDTLRERNMRAHARVKKKQSSTLNIANKIDSGRTWLLKINCRPLLGCSHLSIQTAAAAAGTTTTNSAICECYVWCFGPRTDIIRVLSGYIHIYLLDRDGEREWIRIICVYFPFLFLFHSRAVWFSRFVCARRLENNVPYTLSERANEKETPHNVY